MESSAKGGGGGPSSQARTRGYTCKVIHLLRHGIALNNEPGAHERLGPDQLFDPGLTERGIRQVLECQRLILALQSQVVVVSPLTRALQTALYIFAGQAARPPLVAVDEAREAYGALLPDKRRPKAQLLQQFEPAGVDLSQLTDEDTLWTDVRETVESVQVRAKRLMTRVLHGSEHNVLLIAHGVLIQYCIRFLMTDLGARAGLECHPDYDPAYQVMNCELNSMVMVEMDANDVELPEGAGGDTGLRQDRAGLVRALWVKPVTQQLLAELGGGWSVGMLAWAAQLFLRCSRGAYRMKPGDFCSLCDQCGARSLDEAHRFFYALDVKKQSALGFEEFLIGMVALDPTAPHTGRWRSVRAAFIFRAYDSDNDGILSASDYQTLVQDIKQRQSEAGQQIPAFPPFPAAPLVETLFVQAVETMQIRGTSFLFHLRSSSLTQDVDRRRALFQASGRRQPPRATGAAAAAASATTVLQTPPQGIRPGMPLPPSQVKVDGKVVYYDPGKRVFEVSPHDKDVQRKLMPGVQNGIEMEKTASPGTGPSLVADVIMSTVLRLDPDQEIPPTRGVFQPFQSINDLLPLFEELKLVLASQATLVEVRAPCRVFGDIHGQLGDLLRFFRAYGTPSREGDINMVEYVFNGDFVDRGPHSCDVVLLLFALKVAFPSRVFLIRGNHESRTVNANYGFQAECKTRLGDREGMILWELINSCFDFLPLGARVEGRILVLHGGLGGTLESLDQVASLPRPIVNGESDNEAVAQLLADVLWSDPTANDTVTGVHDSKRGPRVRMFGPDRVLQFCTRNDIDLIIRSHEVVHDGYEFFAAKKLMTVFSATGYCGKVRNDGAILEVNRDRVVTAKVIKYVRDRTQWAVARDSSPPRSRAGV